MVRVVFLTISCVLFGSIFVSGQDVPRLTLNTSGPGAPSRVMAFSSDSQRLYLGGLDKTLHVYEIGWDAVKKGPPVATYGRPILWEVVRGDRGVIFSIAVCPSREELLMGGSGARQQTGDIAVVDLNVDEVSASLPAPAARTAAAAAKRIGSEGHHQLITSLDYSPSGDLVISRDEAGAMMLWRRAAAGFEVSPLISAGTRERFSPLAMFLDERTVVYSRRMDNDRFELIRRRLDSGTELIYLENYPRRVAALARGAEADAWASADDVGNVNITSISKPKERSLVRASLPHVTAMSIGGPRWLAVVSVSEIDGEVSKSVLDLVDLTTGRVVVRQAFGDIELSRAVAVSPDGEFVATVNEDDQSVLIWRIDELISGKQQPNVVAATSHSVMELVRSPDGSHIAFGRDTNDLTHVLDIENAEIRSDATPKDDWIGPVVELPGWRVEALDQPTTTLEARSPTGQLFRVQVDPILQGTVFSFCFLFAPDDPGRVVGMAIGTEHINGVFVYDFDASQQVDSKGRIAAKLVRWFKDHTGTVTALLPMKNGKTLVSGSRDRTIKLWSLEGLFAPVAKEFVNRTHWGCGFAIVDRQVVTQNVLPAGVAFAKGLREGDVITRVQGSDAARPDQYLDAVAPQESPQQILSTLGRVSVLQQILINADPAPVNGVAGKRKAFIIRPAWEPVVTGFVNDPGEWAIWNPDGYFNASAAEGGGLFRWLLNRGQDQPPRVLDGGFLSKEFERPDVIEKLLAGVAIDVALGPISPGKERLIRTIAEIPEVKILTPTTNQIIAAPQNSRVVARIDFGNADRTQFEIRGSIDAVRMGDPAIRDLGNNVVEASWVTGGTGRLNQIEVIAAERGGALSSFYATDVIYRRGSTDNPTPYQLHVLSLASEAYVGQLATSRGGFGKLDYPIDDVQSVIDRLDKKQKEGLGKYRLGEVVVLQDDDISPESVRHAIGKLNRTISTSDGPQLLVVYLSGHGTTLDGEYYYVTTSTRSPEKDAMQEASLPWSLLSSAGPKDCRVVTMIDTCHSGVAVDVKSSVRDPVRTGSVVVAAASGREAAQELAALRHGCFTFSVLLALEGQADSNDGIVDLKELIEYVTLNVQSLTGGEQTPSATPLRLADVLNLPIVAKGTK